MNLTSSGSWIVHGGYGTDRSPAGEIGVHYETGRSDPILLRELASCQLTTSFDVNSLGLLYSLSVTF